jgi:crossover junction endodeoxyribonuclease RusA
MIETAMILDNVELPYPPSVNHFWEAMVFKKNGRTVRGRRRSKRALEFVSAALALLGRRKAFLGAVAVEIDVFFPDRRTRDLDNLAKGIFDAIAHAGVIGDDSQIIDLRLRNMREVVKGGRIVVRLWAVD